MKPFTVGGRCMGNGIEVGRAGEAVILLVMTAPPYFIFLWA